MKTKIILIFVVLLSFFLNVYSGSFTPPGFNADEAAFGYNAYSLLQTARDEYGSLLPLRLKSFGDYKLPLYSYLTVPWVYLFGLSEFSTRFLNLLLSTLMPLVAFFLAQTIFRKKTVSLIFAFLVSISLGLHLISRQAHEAYLAAFLISSALLFFIRYLQQKKAFDGGLFLLCVLLSLFSYQSSRVFALLFIVISAFYVLQKKLSKTFLLVLILVVGLFLLTDVLYPPSRVKNLFFINTPGFALEINQLRGEGGNKIFYNKLALGVKEAAFSYLKYFSPEFLVINGDENPRFGYQGMSLVTPLEYLFFLSGIYFLFYKKEKYRYLLLAFLFIAPITASLSWAGMSLTRSFFILILFLLLAAYGFYNFLSIFVGQKIFTFLPRTQNALWVNEKMNGVKREANCTNAPRASLWVQGLLIALIFSEAFFLFYAWDFYLFHYPKRAVVIRSWQAGYRQLGTFLKNNYNKFDRFYITRKNGQPYIFVLFYLKYPPQKYQKQASLSAPDKYGFGQVTKFDKFNFDFNLSAKGKKKVFIGFPDDFQSFSSYNLDMSKIKKIKRGTEEIFWLYET